MGAAHAHATLQHEQSEEAEAAGAPYRVLWAAGLGNVEGRHADADANLAIRHQVSKHWHSLQQRRLKVVLAHSMQCRVGSTGPYTLQPACAVGQNHSKVFHRWFQGSLIEGTPS